LKPTNLAFEQSSSIHLEYHGLKKGKHMKNSFDQKILEQLEKLGQQISDYGNRLNKLETTESPENDQLYDHPKKSSSFYSRSLLNYSTLLLLSVISLGIGYWFLRLSWHSTIYQLAMLAYATAVIVGGIIKSNKSVRVLGYFLYMCTLFLSAVSYKCNHLLHPHTSFSLHALFAGIFISLVSLICTRRCYQNNCSPREARSLRRILVFLLTSLVFVWGAATIILCFDELSAQPSFFMKPFIEHSRAYDTLIRTNTTQFLLTLYYMIFAFVTFMLGIRYKSWMLRIFGFFTGALSLYSTFLLMTCVRNAGYIALALCLGTVLVVMGYLYARRHNYRIGGGGWI
jgi:hypothetical protein